MNLEYNPHVSTQSTWGLYSKFILKYSKMKLSSLLMLVPFALGAEMEVWDENGNVAYFDDASAERTELMFRAPDKGPRMCGGQKIPSVKKGKFTCARNKDSNGDKKKGKGRKCKFSCDDGWKMKAKKGHKGKAKPAKDGVLKCSEKAGGWKSKPKSLVCVKKD